MRDTPMTHEQFWDAIPWVVNGSLPEAEQRLFATHVENCAECREELVRQQHIHTHLRGPEEAMAAPPAAWDKLLARVDAQPQVPHENATRAGAPRRQRWLVAAVWAQAAVIAGLLAVLWLPASPGEYVTLSSSDPAAHRGAIRVVFAPDTPLERMNDLLRQIDGTIIAGPSEAGVYTVATSISDTQSSIAALRDHREVLFAEPTHVDEHVR